LFFKLTSIRQLDSAELPEALGRESDARSLDSVVHLARSQQLARRQILARLAGTGAAGPLDQYQFRRQVL